MELLFSLNKQIPDTAFRYIALRLGFWRPIRPNGYPGKHDSFDDIGVSCFNFQKNIHVKGIIHSNEDPESLTFSWIKEKSACPQRYSETTRRASLTANEVTLSPCLPNTAMGHRFKLYMGKAMRLNQMKCTVQKLRNWNYWYVKIYDIDSKSSFVEFRFSSRVGRT